MYGKYTATMIAGVNKVTHRFFCRPPSPTVNKALYLCPLISYSFFPLCVADRACLSSGEGKDPNKTTPKKGGSLLLYSFTVIPWISQTHMQPDFFLLYHISGYNKIRCPLLDSHTIPQKYRTSLRAENMCV